MKFKNIIFPLVFLGAAALFLIANPQRKSLETSSAIEKRIDAHQIDVAMLNEQWAVIHKATGLRKDGKIEEAIALYHQAAEMGDPSVPRLMLLEIYEKIKRYDEALVLVDWLLKSNQNEQGRAETLETKARLLQKVKESSATSVQLTG